MISIVSNCPLLVPSATTFRKYHQEHHSHLGVEGWDVDLPTFLEATWIGSAVQKFLWVFCYILVYGVRPMVVRPKSVGAPLPPLPALLSTGRPLANAAHPFTCHLALILPGVPPTRLAVTLGNCRLAGLIIHRTQQQQRSCLRCQLHSG